MLRVPYFSHNREKARDKAGFLFLKASGATGTFLNIMDECG